MNAPQRHPHWPQRETVPLRGILGERVAAGPAVGAFARGESGLLADHVEGSARTFQRGDVRIIGLFDLVVGRPEDLLEPRRPEPWKEWRGRFAFVRHDAATGDWDAVVDAFATLPLYHLADASRFAVATHLRLLRDVPGVGRDVDPAAVYHYLNFACVPAPLSALASLRRLPPASRLRWRDGRSDLSRWWRPTYAEDLDGDEDTLAAGLRERLEATIERYRPGAGARPWGTFLSGGTDSSTITTVLARGAVHGPVHSFSIGFAEAGFDELDFARLAASACGADGHFGSLDDIETLDVLPQLAALYDEPFGNASAVPTLACAALAAREGKAILLAGDGGDEIFGGNERYAKDAWMARCYALPGGVKRFGRWLGARAGGRGHLLLNRIDNFTRRASLPNPDRFYTDDAFASEHHDALLAGAWREAIPTDLSLAFMRELWAGGDARTELHRLMALDLELAIARNDLAKVDGATRHAGVSARFPFLDQDLVAYTGRLPAEWKVRGTRKRYLFRKATAGLLPPAILAKPKQGFGLPISVWMRERPAFRDWMHDLLSSSRCLGRGWFQHGHVAQLFERHLRGEWDWSGPLWQLAVLELWARRHLDGDPS